MPFCLHKGLFLHELSLADTEKYWLIQADCAEGLVSRAVLPTVGLSPFPPFLKEHLCRRANFKWESYSVCLFFFNFFKFLSWKLNLLTPSPRTKSVISRTAVLMLFVVSLMCCCFTARLLLAPQSLVWQGWPRGPWARWDPLTSSSLEKCRCVERKSREALEGAMFCLPPSSRTQQGLSLSITDQKHTRSELKVTSVAFSAQPLARWQQGSGFKTHPEGPREAAAHERSRAACHYSAFIRPHVGLALQATRKSRREHSPFPAFLKWVLGNASVISETSQK